jgi:hypothetical protein
MLTNGTTFKMADGQIFFPTSNDRLWSTPAVGRVSS